MRRLFIAAAVCLFAGIGPALAEDPREKEVRSVEEAFVAAWNKHDPKAMAMTFAPEGDLINPFGRWAAGRPEIEKLFSEEHATFMKSSTYSYGNFKVRFASPAIAYADWDGEVTGMHNPDASASPPFKHHVAALVSKKAGRWWIWAARATAYLPPPGAPSAPPKK